MFGKNISRFLLAAFAHVIELKRAVWRRFCVLGELTNTIVALPHSALAMVLIDDHDAMERWSDAATKETTTTQRHWQRNVENAI